MSEQGRFKKASEGSPFTEGFEDAGRAKSGKGDRTRRAWTDREEEVLLFTLKDLVARGWKSDNGFRNGYQTRIIEAMKREFPNTDLRVHPHIYSKITTWKKCYNSLSLILGRSGVGFNSCGNFRIDCDDEQWAQIVKADPNARYMRNKAWPYWEDWKEIYGKDRACGSRAEGMGEAVKKLNKNPATTSAAPVGGYEFSLDDFFTEEQIHESLNQENVAETCSQDVRSSTSMKKASGKRKIGDALEGILEVMTKMNEDTNDRLQTLSTRIGYDFDLSAKRTEVSRLLGKVHGLTKKQKFVACDILVKEPERLDLFKGLEEEEMPDYVMHILEEANRA